MSFTEGMYRRHLKRQRENPYGRANPSPFGERFTRNGEVMVTRHQLILLRTLYDAPHHTFPSITKWVEAAVPRIGGLTNADKVWRSVARVPEIWVSRTRYGSSKLCALQARGRAIVEGTTPAWLIGEGRIHPGGSRRAAVATEERPSRGQLLDRLDELYWRLIEAGDREAPPIERRVLEDEIELSVWEARRRSNVLGVLDRDLLKRCEAAVAADDLQGFLQAVGALSPDALPEARRLIYGFHHWWQRYLAVEELVLNAETERYGLERATDRRREYREAGLGMLETRLEVRR